MASTRPVGELLRGWRDRRKLSQLDLAIDAGISTRHLSFVETGRSAPSREMVLRIAEHLEVPLRERNQLLVAAGFAPLYRETSLAELGPARDAVRRILDGHTLYPAVVVDRSWRLLDANEPVGLLTAGVAPHLLGADANVLRIALHPDGVARRTVNLGEWRAHLLGRLRKEITLTGDPALQELHDELVAYPCDQPEPVPAGPVDFVVPLRLRHDDVPGGELAFFSIIATFGTPLDVTVAELAIESFFPADDVTTRFLGSVAGTR
ncbi:helix-turn-helix domain-containing protein [Labedaea rhizosphaerae]|uniref:DNA-binding XRE family transcriptional regulator n=1 Tax=Labedaea rhizosphaerae TaxID=598644 RepID=A0A4V3CXZ5_LABRH|nr:helix-turn-helix transcriptional regulator [Labedaea rhizosphaerae]TDP92188.1 DNA-binding XRE family transcriptional regulator [Labedaea rhizosphaerae]